MNPKIWKPLPGDGRSKGNRPRKTRKYEAFIRGPIPEEWLQKAGKIPGAALVIGLMLWQRAYMGGLWGEDWQDRESGEITLGNKFLEAWGTSRSARDRALVKLEKAELITVKRHQGRLPRIQIIDKELLRQSG